MDGGRSLVAEEEKYFYPGELSYIEGAETGIGGER